MKLKELSDHLAAYGEDIVRFSSKSPNNLERIAYSDYLSNIVKKASFPVYRGQRNSDHSL